jgi:hypothetical protein
MGLQVRNSGVGDVRKGEIQFAQIGQTLQILQRCVGELVGIPDYKTS